MSRVVSTFLERWTKIIGRVSFDTSKLRWRHNVRGTEYKIIGEAQVQASESSLTDYEVVVVYQGDDGQLWVRRFSEFMDRFAPLKPQRGKKR